MKAGAVGIEPTSMVLETTVLPLNYAPIVALTEPTNHIIASFCDKSKYFFAKKEAPLLLFSKVCAFTAQTVRKRTGRKHPAHREAIGM